MPYNDFRQQNDLDKSKRLQHVKTTALQVYGLL